MKMITSKIKQHLLNISEHSKQANIIAYNLVLRTQFKHNLHLPIVRFSYFNGMSKNTVGDIKVNKEH